MKLARSIVLILLLVAFGCSSLQILQTPQEKSAFFMSYYLKQREDYERRVQWAQPGLPGYKTEKRVMELKKRFLEEVKEPIKLYDSYVIDGKVPTAAMERVIFEAIARLERELKQ